MRPIPIGSRIIIPAGPSFDAVRRALAAIDAVHGDGDLPTIPVVRTRATTEAGAYEWDERTGEPLRLRLSGLGNHPELTVVHEIGHFLDHQALGRPGTFASESGAIQHVMEAIRQSDASESLRALRQRRFRSFQESHRRVHVPIDQRFVENYLLSREQFARAYAQFIVQMSRTPELIAQLTRVRSSQLGMVYHSQWTDEDFEPIRVALERLLWRRRWMKS
ncbi:MAG: hypothetical protein U0893_06700 [Chloroflexota bacterium]